MDLPATGVWSVGRCGLSSKFFDHLLISDMEKKTTEYWLDDRSVSFIVVTQHRRDCVALCKAVRKNDEIRHKTDKVIAK